MDQPQRKVWPPITAVSRMGCYEAAHGPKPFDQPTKPNNRQAQALDQLRLAQYRAGHSN